MAASFPGCPSRPSCPPWRTPISASCGRSPCPRASGTATSCCKASLRRLIQAKNAPDRRTKGDWARFSLRWQRGYSSFSGSSCGPAFQPEMAPASPTVRKDTSRKPICSKRIRDTPSYKSISGIRRPNGNAWEVKTDA